MEIYIGYNYWPIDFFKNTKEQHFRFADRLDQTAEEATSLAKIWSEVAQTILSGGAADAENNIFWTKLIERPEWTIYSTNIPKSRFEKFSEKIVEVAGKNTYTEADFAVVRIGSILLKRNLTNESVEMELEKIKDVHFFDKANQGLRKISLAESIAVLNREAEAITVSAREFRANLILSSRKPARSNVVLNFFRMFFLRKITQPHLLKEFREKYIHASGLNVTDDFLSTRSVYAVFDLKNRMRGGFVLGNSTPYRTIEVFAGEPNRQKLYDYIKGSSYCELNCLWLSIKYRKGFMCYWFWILFALQVSRQREAMLIYGTIAKGLADIYGYPRKSKLLHTEEKMFSNKMRTHWIFIGARTDFFVGVLETFVYKFKNNGKRPVKYKRVPLSGKAA